MQLCDEGSCRTHFFSERSVCVGYSYYYLTVLCGHGGEFRERLGMGLFYLILEFCACLSGGHTDVSINCRLCGTLNHTNFVEISGKKFLEVVPNFIYGPFTTPFFRAIII